RRKKTKRRKPPRSPKFGVAQVRQMRSNWLFLSRMVLAEVARKIGSRTKNRSYLKKDDALFEPYIDTYVLGSVIDGFSSAFTRLGNEVLEEVRNFEQRTGRKINKEQMYFAMSINAVQSGDE